MAELSQQIARRNEARQIEGSAFPTAEYFFYARLLYHIDNDLAPLQARLTAYQQGPSHPEWTYWDVHNEERYDELTQARELAKNTLREENWPNWQERQLRHGGHPSQCTSDELWSLFVSIFNENEENWHLPPAQLQGELERFVDLLIAGFEELEVLPHFFDEGNVPARDFPYDRLEWHVVRDLREDIFDPRRPTAGVRALELQNASLTVGAALKGGQDGSEVRFNGLTFPEALLPSLQWRERTLRRLEGVLQALDPRNDDDLGLGLQAPTLGLPVHEAEEPDLPFEPAERPAIR